jgi:hypothetical protein
MGAGPDRTRDLARPTAFGHADANLPDNIPAQLDRAPPRHHRRARPGSGRRLAG